MKKNVAIVGVTMLLAVYGLRAAPVDTPERDGRFMAVTAGAAIDQGAMVCMYTDAEAYEAADTANYAVIGRAQSSGAEGETVLVKRGVFRWANYGSFTDKDIGQQCYVSNSVGVTTATVAGNDVIAGVIVDVDSDGVWVDTFNQKVTLTTTVTTLAVSGAATVGTTLGVTGATTLGSTLGVTGAATLSSTLAATGAARLQVRSPLVLTATAITLTNAVHGGQVIMVNTNDAVTITLPANGAAAGTWFDVAVMGSNDCAPTVAAATQDTLVGPNDPDLDSVTWGTGHRMGAYARFISDGAFWHVLNLGGTTMTYTD